MNANTLHVTVNRDMKTVYEFILNAENLPKWATTFCKAVKRTSKRWTIETSQGSMGLRFAEKNALGVVDHYLAPASGGEVYVPMRVVANGSGSEVLFTLFRMPEMSDEQFAQDMKLVEQGLNTLKRVMEA